MAGAVRTFGESYNHYLSQIKAMMDALSAVAAQTGETLFAGENADLKARFGSRMQEYLGEGEAPTGEEAPDDPEIPAEAEAPLEGEVAAEQPPVPHMG